MRNDLTEIAYILDRSSSMIPLREAAVKAFNDFVAEQAKAPGEALLNLVLFNNSYSLEFEGRPVQEIPPMTSRDYRPIGYTALFDAIGTTIDRIGKRLSETPETQRPGQVIIAIFTDGQENASREYSLEQINQMIRHQREKYSWEFIFLAAGQDAMETAGRIGIDRDSAANIDFSNIGMSVKSRAMIRKTLAYRNRARGEQSPDIDKPMEDIVREEEAKPE